HDVVLRKRDVTFLIAFLLEPGESPSVRRQGCHDVVQSVAVHVVDSISAPPTPKFDGWKAHVFCVEPLGGCSHHPRAPTTSMRPSPLMSPTPMPWAPSPPASEIAVTIQRAV